MWIEIANADLNHQTNDKAVPFFFPDADCGTISFESVRASSPQYNAHFVKRVVLPSATGFSTSTLRQDHRRFHFTVSFSAENQRG